MNFLRYNYPNSFLFYIFTMYVKGWCNSAMNLGRVKVHFYLNGISIHNCRGWLKRNSHFGLQTLLHSLKITVLCDITVIVHHLALKRKSPIGISNLFSQWYQVRWYARELCDDTVTIVHRCMESLHYTLPSIVKKFCFHCFIWQLRIYLSQISLL